MKETIQTAAESFLPALWAMSRAMYDHPELGLEEVNSSRMLREWLAEQGFKVEENFHGLPTACRAVYGSGRPVLGFLCEYDALPEVGHGCGHDLIGVVSAGAAAVLRQTVDAVGGTLIVYGTPDEEITCTKVQLTDEGAFDELDVALMLHPYQKTCSPGLSCWRLSGPTSSGASGNRTRKEFHHHAIEKSYHGGQDYLGWPKPPGAPPGGGRHSCVRYPLRRRGQLPLRHL